MLSIFLCILACGSQEDSASEKSNTPSTDTSSEQTSEPSSETEPSSEASTEPSPETEPSSEPNLDFCSMFSETCGSWSTSTSCEEWWISFETGTYDQNGNPMDTVGQTQSCFEYHLEQAATMTEQSDIELYCSYAVGGTDAQGNAPCGEPPSEDPAEVFCDAFYDICEDWPNVHVDCTEWFASKPEGTPGDSTGATQACYQYHLDMAATMTNVYDVERYCTYAVGSMDDQGNKPCKD